MPSHPSIAVVGATGAVGREMISILESREFPLSSLRLFASPRSAGSTIDFRGESLPVEVMIEGALRGVDIALFSAGSSVSKAFAPSAVRDGTTIIDNASAFRMDPSVPLVVPEVNGDALDDVIGRGEPALIANPNCSTIIALMAVTPLHRAVGIARMVVSTYQAVSGAGAAAMEDLEKQARDWAAGHAVDGAFFGRQTLFNVFSHNSAVGADGYNEEETKLLRETHRIWNDDSVRVTATCVRVPVLRAHCESINLTFKAPLSEDDARDLLAAAPGVTIIDDRANNRFPEPLMASGVDDVLVGRIRADRSQAPGMGLDLFVAGDQIRKGAALNAVQIAERLVARGTGTSSAAGAVRGVSR